MTSSWRFSPAPAQFLAACFSACPAESWCMSTKSKAVIWGGQIMGVAICAKRNRKDAARSDPRGRPRRSRGSAWRSLLAGGSLADAPESAAATCRDALGPSGGREWTALFSVPICRTCRPPERPVLFCFAPPRDHPQRAAATSAGAGPRRLPRRRRQPPQQCRQKPCLQNRKSFKAGVASAHSRPRPEPQRRISGSPSADAAATPTPSLSKLRRGGFQGTVTTAVASPKSCS